MSDEAITAVDVIETEYGEKVAIQSPFDAKDFIKALPFMEYNSYDDYHTEMNDNGVADGAIQAAEDFEFSEDFAAYRSWDPNAFGYEDGGWVIDTDALDEAFEFFEFAGFETENRTDV